MALSGPRIGACEARRRSTIFCPMSEARSIVRDGRVYAISNVINRAAGLVLLPVFTHVLSPAEFGRYTLVQSMIEVLSVLGGLGLRGTMNR